MGKGIVYCGDCGESLREDDFERGRAHRIEGSPYCTRCRTPDPTPPTGKHAPLKESKVASGRITPVNLRRVPKAAPTARGPGLPLILGIVGGGILLLLLIAAAFSRGPR
jgi:hypothetical protein